jgi:hypothetical protein
MAVRHLRLREHGWRKGLVINGFGAFLSLVVDIIFAVTKFTHGAWVIIALVPIMVFALMRLNKQYESEAAELEEDAKAAAEAPVLRKHVVLVLVDRLDRAAARAIQYARTLHPDELRAVHVAVDLYRADVLADDWRRLGLTRLPLEIVDCPDRRLDRSVLEIVAECLGAGDTEVSVLVPRLAHRRAWHRLLHDRTGEQIADAVGRLAHANVTFVPYHLGSRSKKELVDADSH